MIFRDKGQNVVLEFRLGKLGPEKRRNRQDYADNKPRPIEYPFHVDGHSFRALRESVEENAE
jgi:hypothetical protein